jgi:hypothetical protein
MNNTIINSTKSCFFEIISKNEGPDMVENVYISNYPGSGNQEDINLAPA